MGGGRRLKSEGTHVHLWLIQVVVWQTPTEHSKAIICQLKKICENQFPIQPLTVRLIGLGILLNLYLSVYKKLLVKY